MSECPCKDCLVLPVCKQKITITEIEDDCKLAMDFLDSTERTIYESLNIMEEILGWI